MGPFRMPVRAVLYREEGRWVAHCLEFDLIGDGESPAEAVESLNEAISIQVQDTLKSGNARNLFSPADGEYFEMFAAGKSVAQGVLTLRKISADGIEIEGVDTREYDVDDLVPA